MEATSILSKFQTMPGTVQLSSNGEGAKTAKVSIVANSGKPYYYDGLGYIVQDFSGMTSKQKIPLDYEHDQTIGYLNNHDASAGELVSSGVMVLENIGGVDVVAIANQLAAGVPYEASLEFEDCDVEYLPEGLSTIVNGNQVDGPIYIMRRWNLMAVAICKFGKDSLTSVSYQMSEKKPLFIKLSNKKDRYMSMDKVDPKDVKPVKAVEAVVEDKTKEPVKVVEPEPVNVIAVETEAEVKGKSEDDKAEVVETPKEVEVIPDVPLGKTVEAPVQLSQTVEAKADPRHEYKAFVAKFGREQGGEYFEQGLSMQDATDKFVSYQGDQIKQLSKKVDGLDRGGKAPIKLSAEKGSTGKLEDLIRLK